MTSQPQHITIRRPDDWHIHLRDGVMLESVLPYTSAVNGRAIVMPNLVPPVTSTRAPAKSKLILFMERTSVRRCAW